jgi:hypothetical protein
MNFNKLIERLKGKGLDLAEDAARLVVIETFGWLEEEVLASENKLDDVLIALFPIVQKFVLEQVDKIDSKVG